MLSMHEEYAEAMKKIQIPYSQTMQEGKGKKIIFTTLCREGTGQGE
jgi:hypothetical protein